MTVRLVVMILPGGIKEASLQGLEDQVGDQEQQSGLAGFHGGRVDAGLGFGVAQQPAEAFLVRISATPVRLSGVPSTASRVEIS